MGAMLLTAACTTNPETGNQRLSKAAIGGVAGAVGGYFLGDLIGGRGDRTAKIVGAGIGAVAGAGIGAYMDSQERNAARKQPAPVCALSAKAIICCCACGPALPSSSPERRVGKECVSTCRYRRSPQP